MRLSEMIYLPSPVIVPYCFDIPWLSGPLCIHSWSHRIKRIKIQKLEHEDVNVVDMFPVDGESDVTCQSTCHKGFRWCRLRTWSYLRRGRQAQVEVPCGRYHGESDRRSAVCPLPPYVDQYTRWQQLVASSKRLLAPTITRLIGKTF